MQRGSLRLYTAFIDFKQAYDLIPRDKLLNHLNYVVFYCQMPQHLMYILQGYYHADEYTMLDRDIRATIFWCQTRVPPLPPTIFSLPE
jgi:hypothetical protein